MEYNESTASRRLMRDYGKQKKQEELEYYKQAVLVPVMPRFKGHHTSLTEEMLVPLILLNNKK